MRTTIIIGSALALAVVAGCDNARDQQEKVNKAQSEANEKIAEVNQQANEKVVEAQAEADKKTAEAQATFAKLREDYRHDVNTKLTDLDKKISDLDVKARTEKAPKRVELEAKLTDIRSTREAFVSEYRAIDNASAMNWDDVKKRIDKSLSDLEAKVSRA